MPNIAVVCCDTLHGAYVMNVIIQFQLSIQCFSLLLLFLITHTMFEKTRGTKDPVPSTGYEMLQVDACTSAFLCLWFGCCCVTYISIMTGNVVDLGTLEIPCEMEAWYGVLFRAGTTNFTLSLNVEAKKYFVSTEDKGRVLSANKNCCADGYFT